MKIAVIASSLNMSNAINDLAERRWHNDQVVTLLRQQGVLHLERIDSITTNVVLVDTKSVQQVDLDAIAECTRERGKPVFIYLCESPNTNDYRRLMQAGVTEVVGLPLEDDELCAALERIRARHYLSLMYQARGRIVTFVSCKGGAGATFVATNIAYVLSQEFAQRVLFIDLHMQDGDAAFYVMEKIGNQSLGDVVRQTGLDSTVIASASQQVAEGFYLLKAPESPEMAAGVSAQQIDTLISLATQDYDFVILDIPHHLDAINMKALDRADEIVMVMQPMVAYLRAMVRQLRVFSMLGYVDERIQVVLNRMDNAVVLPLSKMQETLGREISYVVPNDFRKATESANLGIPIGKLAANAPLTESLRAICRKLCDVPVTEHQLSGLSKVTQGIQRLFRTSKR